MNKIGFLISHKDNEKRRAILPRDIRNINYPDKIWIEKSYGEALNILDEEYIKAGALIKSRKEILECDVLVDVKLSDATFLDHLTSPKVLVGWAHAVQSLDFTSKVLDGGHTVYAWEEVFESGRYIFYRNREIAGEAAILHAYPLLGKMPYETKVAILGNGQTAKGALRILHGLGADVDIYPRKMEKLFKEKMFEYDVIVNCVMWDTSRTDRIIYKEDLKKFGVGTMIIDVSADKQLEIETSSPTTISDPIYVIDGVIHYVVDNTPSMFPITVSHLLSSKFAPYYNQLIENKIGTELKEARVIQKGKIIDSRIKEFRKAKGLICK